MKDHDLAEKVQAVRYFNRFYTKHIGVLKEGFFMNWLIAVRPLHLKSEQN
jgi:hypothetical protein